jgi:hypothetical protein
MKEAQPIAIGGSDIANGLQYLFDGEEWWGADVTGLLLHICRNLDRTRRKFGRIRSKAASDVFFSTFPEFKPFFPVSLGGTRVIEGEVKHGN